MQFNRNLPWSQVDGHCQHINDAAGYEVAKATDGHRAAYIVEAVNAYPEFPHAERTAYEIAYSALSDLQQGLTEPSHEGGLTRADALAVVSAAIGRIHHLLGKG